MKTQNKSHHAAQGRQLRAANPEKATLRVAEKIPMTDRATCPRRDPRRMRSA
ncbi:MAG: hypothetical protein IPJ35_09770 [Elusimicrobia bacterium]|nr:hypothetical protein [Elusimicrobiota bacterium]